jgi:VCBS repeat-containing protein
MRNAMTDWKARAVRGTVIALLLVAFVTAGCEDDTPGPVPTPPPAPTTTDTFTGTLNINGAFTYPFTVVALGTMTLTLTSISDNTVTVSVSLGTWNGVTCQIFLANDQAAQGAVVTGVPSGVGNYCARISDVGKLTDSVTFELTVVHP